MIFCFKVLEKKDQFFVVRFSPYNSILRVQTQIQGIQSNLLKKDDIVTCNRISFDLKSKIIRINDIIAVNGNKNFRNCIPNHNRTTLI